MISVSGFRSQGSIAVQTILVYSFFPTVLSVYEDKKSQLYFRTRANEPGWEVNTKNNPLKIQNPKPFVTRIPKLKTLQIYLNG